MKRAGREVREVGRNLVGDPCLTSPSCCWLSARELHSVNASVSQRLLIPSSCPLSVTGGSALCGVCVGDVDKASAVLWPVPEPLRHGASAVCASCVPRGPRDRSCSATGRGSTPAGGFKCGSIPAPAESRFLLACCVFPVLGVEPWAFHVLRTHSCHWTVPTVSF